jgi:hypothetical protein
MDRFNFWWKWLMGVTLYLVAFGLVLAIFPQSRIMDIVFNNQIDPVFWPDGNLPEASASFQSWMYGVLGSVIAGWGISMFLVVRYPFNARAKWSWNCMALGITLWFVVDTALSATHHVWFNVGFNTILWLLIVIPLVFTRKHFATG